MTVDNAYISCPTNWSCTAECYRGFIFPNASTKENYSCQNGVWAPMLPSCKRTVFFAFFDWMYVYIWLIVSKSFNGLDLHYFILVTLWGHVKVCFLHYENESVNDNFYLRLFLLLGLPLVFVHYYAVWTLTDVLPSKCPNISTRLDTHKDLLEKTLAEKCQELGVNATVQFTYSFLSFQVCIYQYAASIVGQYYRHACYLIFSILLRLPLQSYYFYFFLLR